MAGINIASAQQRRGGSRFRPGYVLDMTPLVDIAFLLLTFFMFSTSMNTPQAMEMAVPKEGMTMQGVTMEMILREDGRVFYHLDDGIFQTVRVEELGTHILGQYRKADVLHPVLLVADHASYGTMIDILDVLSLSAAEAGHRHDCALLPATEEDLEKVRAL